MSIERPAGKGVNQVLQPVQTANWPQVFGMRPPPPPASLCFGYASLVVFALAWCCIRCAGSRRSWHHSSNVRCTAASPLHAAYFSIARFVCAQGVTAKLHTTKGRICALHSRAGLRGRRPRSTTGSNFPLILLPCACGARSFGNMRCCYI